MMWIGILLISMVVSFILLIMGRAGLKGDTGFTKVMVFFIMLAMVYAMITAAVFGIMFIVQGIKAW